MRFSLTKSAHRNHHNSAAQPLWHDRVVLRGWLFFEGVYVGTTEEIPFRALRVTYLATTMPARLRLGRFELHWAGVMVAVIFALLHANNLLA